MLEKFDLRPIRKDIDRYLRRRDSLLALGLAQISSTTGEKYLESAARRRLGRVIAGPAWLITLPLQAIARAKIKAEDHGQTTFFDERLILRNGQLQPGLRVRKLRTMRTNADDIPVCPEDRGTTRDPRNTKIGQFLREHDFDEVPQLAQVFSGELALVGPRAIATRDLEQLTGSPRFEEWKKAYRTPALFSPDASVLGEKRKGRRITALDIIYGENASLGTDLYFLARYFLGLRV